ncbi:RelA/SpoT family protein [Chloroflexota bacterium]
MDVSLLLEKAGAYLSPDKLGVIDKAYQFAQQAHQGQTRRSGEPFMEHPIETAIILVDLQLGSNTLTAALLHDVVEDCGVPLNDIESRFGPEVSKLVGAVTKLNKITWRTPGGQIQGNKHNGEHAENLRHMLLAMAEDLRVVFIKLADRLHNMRTLGAFAPEKRRRIAQETLEIYAPLAHRLGIWNMKWQLEDLSFRYLDPRHYHQVARQLDNRRAQRENFIQKFSEALREALEKEGIKADVLGRPKHIYSIHQKIVRYTAIGKDFEDIHDLFAVRVLVDTVPECYRALGVVHSLWHPFTEEFDDYIANPKDNGYRSLHTTVLTEGAVPLEVQIRTREMHHVANYGVAAHWSYKEGREEDEGFERKLAWLRQLSEWQKDLSGEEFLESVKTDVFADQVFVFTPQEQIKVLPRGATPLDFAYRIHTELGHKCVGSKVNGRMVPLSYRLKSGDVVEILSQKGKKGPSLDWLNPSLGIVSTSHARGKIRQWFKKQEKGENIERGRDILERELRRLGISVATSELAELFGYNEEEDFLAALGFGGITPHQVATRLGDQREQPRVVTPAQEPARQLPAPGIKVTGVSNLLTHVARCCNPLPGDSVIGYITLNRGVTVHRKDCYNILRDAAKERLVNVEWGEADQLYPTMVHIDAWDRVGLLRDITTIVAEEKVNIGKVDSIEQPDNTVSITLDLNTRSIMQLSKLLSKLSGIRGVTSVERKSI